MCECGQTIACFELYGREHQCEYGPTDDQLLWQRAITNGSIPELIAGPIPRTR